MVSKVHSMGLNGISGYPVSVECFLSQGLPGFDIVGLPDTAIKESRERVRAAVKNSGFKFPVSRITVNLAPADTRKEGSIYDLPILLGILAAADLIDPMPDDCVFLGELSLEGILRPVHGMLPMALHAARLGFKHIFVPEDNAAEATLAEDILVYPVKNVREITEHFSGTKIAPAKPWVFSPGNRDFAPDFSDVKGQENVKRALEIAAAGSHNILLIGPPGAGKSMLARRLPSILPDMSREESLAASEIHSIVGLSAKDHPLITERPFRSPHHTISAIGLSGGGGVPRPGEISLAHMGILFLDELPEFSKSALEILRQPMEDGTITLSRVAGSVTYPSDFMLVCAMNPCRCGWYGHQSGKCACTELSVKNYRGRVSGPLLDRIDIHVDVPSVKYDELSGRAPAEASAEVRRRVNRARSIQTERYKNSGVNSNARLTQPLMREHCTLDKDCESLMRGAFERLGLTARSYDRIIKVARTIADLDGSTDIKSRHLAEAIQFRAHDDE